MPRPTKFRKVDFFPQFTYFVPVDKDISSCDKIILKVEELQAMRLKDTEELSQEQCAERMQISRQTFQNIIDSARKKVTKALCDGIPIIIGGGDYTTTFCNFKCMNCGNVYELRYEQDRYTCPKCGDNRVICSRSEEFCKKWCSNDESDKK